MDAFSRHRILATGFVIEEHAEQYSASNARISSDITQHEQNHFRPPSLLAAGTPGSQPSLFGDPPLHTD